MLTTKRLHIRPFNHRDLTHLFELHANPEVAKTTIDGIQSLETVKKHLEDFIIHQDKYSYSQFAIFENDGGKFIGRAGITCRALNEEIGELPEIRFAFLPQFWGQGYAFEVTAELVRFAFKDLKLKTLSATHGMTNQKSARILTKNGFKFINNIKPKGHPTTDEIRFYLQHNEKINSNG